MSRPGEWDGHAPRTALQRVAHNALQHVPHTHDAIIVVTKADEGEESRIGSAIRMAPTQAVLRLVSLAVDLAMRSALPDAEIVTGLCEIVAARARQHRRESAAAKADA